MGHLNITAQCCGLVVVCLLLIFYLSSKRIGLRSEKTFILAMVVSIVSLILDISSLFAIRYLSIGSTPLNIICKTYLVSLVFAGGSAFIYIFGDCYVGKKFKSILIAIGVITMVEGAVILNLPISYHVEDETIYTLGPSVMMTFACALFYVFLTIVLMAVFRKRINSRRRHGVALWLGIWIAAALVQFFNNDILLVGFACSLGMLILFIMLE
ncbi:MAG: hypothetical protein J6X60_06395, partial [Ruminiclostridium sp.]|nr:hypothetical protein [Ruminiclostridium sp.]